jgi:hypothetical protein
MVRLRIRRIKPRRQDHHGTPSTIDRTLVRGSVDPDGAPGHHYDALKRSMACEIIRVVERLFVGTTSAHDRDGAIEIRQLAHDAKQARGIGQVAKLRRVVGAQSAHQLSARR